MYVQIYVSRMYSSYQLKWAVDDKLRNTDVDSLGLGPSIRLVMEPHSIRDKFLSVSGDLSMMGYSGVQVTNRGFRFTSKQGKYCEEACLVSSEYFQTKT